MSRNRLNKVDVILICAWWLIAGAVMGVVILGGALWVAMNGMHDNAYHPTRALAADIIIMLLVIIYVCTIGVLVASLILRNRPKEQSILKLIAKIPEDKAIAALAFLSGISLAPICAV